MKGLILGVGQPLRRDDAAGLEAVRLWQVHHSDTAKKVKVEFCEIPGMEMLDLFKEMDKVIIVDAVNSTDSPGSIIKLQETELSNFTTYSRNSHGWGVAETLLMGRSLYPELSKCLFILVGIVGKDFSMGSGLSPEVRKAIPKAEMLIEAEI